MDDRIVLRVSTWPSTTLDKKDNVFHFQAYTDAYMALLREWGKQHKEDLNSLRITIEPYFMATDWAKRFFFHCLDIYAKGVGESSESFRKVSRDQLKTECNIRTGDGELKTLSEKAPQEKQVTTKDLWDMTERLISWCDEPELGIDTRMLKAERKDLKDVHKEELDSA